MTTVLAVFGLGGWEVVLILAAVLILFGAKKLPELAKGLGQGIKEFKKATTDVQSEFHNAMDDNRPTPPQRRLDNPPDTQPQQQAHAPVEEHHEQKS
ncbi:MAG: sec-independent protein translocase protein TatA [Verrucomicrobiota bacterium]|jgi:sec-independent protein translocase protein TatA